MTEAVLMEFIVMQNRVIAAQGEALRIVHEFATMQAAQIKTAIAELRQDLVQRMVNLQTDADQIQEAISELNQETDNIAARIMALETQFEGELTDEQREAIKGQLRSIAGRLRSLAAVPTNPVPGGTIPADQPLQAVITK